MLLQPETFGQRRRPAMVGKAPAAAGIVPQARRSNVIWPLADAGSEQRWHQLQQLRRGLHDPGPWLEALANGSCSLEPDVLAALVPGLQRSDVERLLQGPVGLRPAGLFEGIQPQWPGLVVLESFRQAWLEPLLRHSQAAAEEQQLIWLQLLGAFRDRRVAARLRQAITSCHDPASHACLLPLLGLQREPEDASLLLRLAREPGPRALRHQALEGLALGLSAWPQPELMAGLRTLVGDLEVALAAKAVDLLARMPAGPAALRHCLTQDLDADVLARLQRRLRSTPLVLVVHGRRDGQIPAELQALATALAQRRGTPVLLQALTAAAPAPQPSFWASAQRAGAITLVPLLLLPGGHVRADLPAIAHAWTAMASAAGVGLQRRPFLGAWPAWQDTIARELRWRCSAQQRHALWLHHPLEGALAARYVSHLSGVLGCAALSTTYGDPMAALHKQPLDHTLLMPLTLAANRLSESLETALTTASPAPDRPEVLPPLLRWPALKRFVLDALLELS